MIGLIVQTAVVVLIVLAAVYMINEKAGWPFAWVVRIILSAVAIIVLLYFLLALIGVSSYRTFY